MKQVSLHMTHSIHSPVTLCSVFQAESCINYIKSQYFEAPAALVSKLEGCEEGMEWVVKILWSE